jgi:phage-related minor tail protein
MPGNAVELATAYVSIVPSFEGGREKISKELIPDAEGAGKEAGKKAGKGIGAGLSSVGASVAKIGGVGLAGALTGGFIAAIESTDINAKLAAQLSLTPAQATKAGDAAGSLYAHAYGGSLSETSEAVGAVMSSMHGMSDASQGDIEAITASALDLSTAFGVDVGESATTAGILMKNGLAKDGTAAMDLITASMQKLPASIRGEVLPTMDEYSKHFAGLGIDGETAMGMIVAAGANGAIGMDKMGDALKEFTIRSTDMSSSTQGAYDDLGLSTEDMTRRILAGGDSAKGAMGEIVGALQGVQDPAKQSALALALFGTPLEDLGTDQIPAFLGMIDPMGDKFDSTAGAAAKFGTTLNSGPGVALEQLKRTSDVFFTSLAETAMPALTAVLGFINSNTWVLTALAAVVGGALVLAFAAWAVSAWAVVAPLLANPVTWIVLAIIALIAALVLLVMNWDTVVKWVTEVWGGFVNWAGEIFAGLGSWLTEIWDGFVSWFMGVLSGFTSWISGIWSGLWDWIGAVFAGFGSWLASIWNGIASFFIGALNAYVSFWLGIWTGIANFVMSVWNGIVSFIAGIPGAIFAYLGQLAALGGMALAWFGGVLSAGMAKLGELIGFVAGIPGQIIGFFVGLGSMLFNAGSQIIGGLLDGIKAGFQGVMDFVGGIGGWIADHKGPKAYDMALLIPAGGWIMGGLSSGLRAEIPALQKTMTDITDTIQIGGARGVGVDVSGQVAVAGAPAAAAAYAGAPPGPVAGGAAGRVLNLTVNNPVPEPAGASITSTLAKVAYLGLEGD